MTQVQLDLKPNRMLLADWFMVSADEAGYQFDASSGHSASAGGSFTFRAPDEWIVTARFIEAQPFLQFTSSDESRQQIVDDLVQRAQARLKAGDLGIHWYSASLGAPGFQLGTSPCAIWPMIQQLGAQARIIGWRRLGSDVLIEFAEELPEGWDEKNVLLAPKAITHVHMAVPGPRVGFLSSHIASVLIETIAAICTFALGRGVALPPTVFPSKQEKVPDLNARRADQTVGTLARKGVSLDIFSPISIPGGREFFERLRAAFLTFDAAAHQHHKFVASILYVVCAESLTTPNADWRHSKLTKRFVEFFDELIPSELEQIVNHDNFEDAFRTRRGSRTLRPLRRELLDKIYELRSGLVHSGLRPSYSGFEIGISDDVRCNLMADFTEGAILGYLASPRSSLIGHPEITKA